MQSGVHAMEMSYLRGGYGVKVCMKGVVWEVMQKGVNCGVVQ